MNKSTTFPGYGIVLCIIATLMQSAFISGCLPTEESVQESSSQDETYGGFEGLTEVKTVSDTKVQLKWKSADDPRVTAYNVYDVTLRAVPKLIRTVDASRTSTIIAGLSQGFYYRFRVRAVDEEGEEDVNENDVAGIPYGGVTGVTVLSSTSALIKFHNVEDGEALELDVYCKTSENNEYERLYNVRNMELSSVTLTDLTANVTYTCKAHIYVEGVYDNNTEVVTFQSLGKASQLIFATEPGNGAAGETLVQQPIIHILDANGNIVSGGPDSTALITLEVSANSPTVGSVRGSYSINAVGGVATFSDIFLQEAGAKILTAKKEDTSSEYFGTGPIEVESATFNITSGNVDATLSEVIIDPAVPPASPKVANGSDSYTVTVILRDSFGNPISGIKPRFSSNIVGDFIIQPLMSTDANGETSGTISTTVADDLPPARILSVSSPAGLEDVQALAPFTAGQAKKLSFAVQPVNSPAGALAMNEIKVAVQDQQGNTVVSGSNSTLPISLSIASNTNGATLLGTYPINAVSGVATFSDLGIDMTKTGYSLVASSGSLSPAYSNSFNITAGVPQVLSITGPGEVVSGACSAAITLQLQDQGGNPAKAIQNTTVQISGLGNASLYSSNSCGGSALGSSVTFTPGTDTRTVYLQSSKVEALNISGTDTSAVLEPGYLNINVTPSKISLLAQAVGGGTLSVPAGSCSTKMVITPLAEDGSKGQVFSNTAVMITGIAGSQAKLYSDSNCTTEIDPASFSLAINALPNSETNIYIKDPKGETLNLNVTDPYGVIQTTSTPQEVIITASNLDLTGPATVVAGTCSTAFTLNLVDTLGNPINTKGDLSLSINGIDGVSDTGQLFTSPSCSGAGSATSLTIPDGNATLSLYYKGIAAEVLEIFLSDPAGNLQNSQTLTLTVTPSALEIVGPTPAESLTSECAGPYDVRTLDGLGDPANAVLPITVELTGAGVAGQFHSDTTCNTEITSLDFAVGEGQKTFYFLGQYPDNLSLTASDSEGVLTTGTLSWVVKGDWGWLGTAVSDDEKSNHRPFRTGVRPVAAHYDGLKSAYDAEFSPDKRYLYVADYYGHRVLKFDYETNEYIGWMGRLDYENGVGATGSNLSDPSPALCINTPYAGVLPGWCTGGTSLPGWEWEIPRGAIRYPTDIATDGTFVYVANYNIQAVTRYYADTGEFAGWLGPVGNTSPTGPAPGGPASCSSVSAYSMSPGWCMEGRVWRIGHSNYDWEGDGRWDYLRAVEVDSTYMYLAVHGAVLRFNKTTGAFAGWIGRVKTTPTSGAAGCTLAATDDITPGWCFGGEFKRSTLDVGGFYTPDRLLIHNGLLYVLDNAYGTYINTYDISSGEFAGTLSNMNHNWKGSVGFTTDGTKLYIADEERLLKTDFTGLIEGWMGKVANNSGMSGNTGCSTLQPNDNTPGWCNGGTGKGGLDGDSFIRTRFVTSDGRGSILAGGERFPGLKKFNAATGEFEGVLAFNSSSPSRWSSNRTMASEGSGFDDEDMDSPRGVLVHGDYLYVAEFYGSRIKKINKLTGELVGWIGGMTSKPTAGVSSLCESMSGMGPSPAWCKGANFYPSWLWYDPGMINYDVDGLMRYPIGLATDGTWLYVSDYGAHRIQRFKIDDGSFGGWIGQVRYTPTGGDPGCTSAVDNDFTPGWCLGGWSEAGNTNGGMWEPGGMTYAGGSLYVINTYHHNVSKYNATTGAFEGWIGRVNAMPTSGCVPASNGNYTVSSSGWCMDGTSQAGHSRDDRGGGFYFGDTWSSAIATDGTYLYISNGYTRRIERYNMNGEWLEATLSEGDNYTKTWTSDRDVLSSWDTTCSRPAGIWVDGTNMYTMNRVVCAGAGGQASHVVKYDLDTGTVVGWKGGVSPDYPTSGGETGCVGATGTTPGWCQGGRAGVGSVLGQFRDETVGAIAGDAHFLYVTDMKANRVIRIPR